MLRQPYLVFGRDDTDDGDEAAWWPLWVEDGPQLADSAEAAIATVWGRLILMQETHWTALAAVPAMDWHTVTRAGGDA